MTFSFDDFDGLDGQEPDEGLPPLLRRPEPVADPLRVPQLRGTRKALLANPEVSLDEAAANAVTSGAVDPERLQALVAHEPINLLTAKPVVGGMLYVTPPHYRYLDVDVLPDFINQRWADQLHTAMDVAPSTSVVPAYETVVDPETGKPLAVFAVRMRDRKALATAVGESMRKTCEAQKGKNVYTSSVLQQGVKEPLTLFVMRVVFDDGTEDTFLVAGDGNSRMVSMWLARTGGDIEMAISACTASVIGSTERSGGRSRAEQAAARRRVTELTERTRKNLAAPTLTEATRRDGHTLAFPAIVVVGAQADGGGPLADLVAARDDLLATLHVRVTPWTDGAQNTQGMQRVYRHALREGLITREVYQVLSGTVGTQAMHELLGVPAHRLWSAAVHQHAVLAGAQANAMNLLIKQEFGMRRAFRQQISERLAPMALSAYRSKEGIEQPLRAFGEAAVGADRGRRRLRGARRHPRACPGRRGGCRRGADRAGRNGGDPRRVHHAGPRLEGGHRPRQLQGALPGDAGQAPDAAVEDLRRAADAALHRRRPCRRRPGRAAEAVPHPGAQGRGRGGPRRRAHA